MRFLGPVLLLVALLAGTAAAADPASQPSPRAQSHEEADRLELGAEPAFWSARFGLRVGLGLTWRLPQRWYDADGTLLTERSLLHPGDDLERSGLYFAVRF